MPTRLETAAATRLALLRSAGELLDLGGPDTVTLREVGARAGVSRSAPYRHFPDKDSLLTVLATQAWTEIGDSLQRLVQQPDLSPDQALRGALSTLTSVGRARPHLYRLMFTTPATDPTAAGRAASRAQDLFIDIVARLTEPDIARQLGGLLLTSAHGATTLELSGHLPYDKWRASAEDLLDLLVTLIPRAHPHQGP